LFKCRYGRYEMPQEKCRPRLLLGVRPCDAKAFWLLDHVFMAKGEEDIYWEKRREDSLVVSFGCDSPCATCFCTSVGGHPYGKEGSDVQISEVDGDYYFESLTEKGAKLIVELPEAGEDKAKNVKQLKRRAFARHAKSLQHGWFARSLVCAIR